MSFAGGDGTEDSPFEVSSAAELENIGQLLYCNFRLTQNISLSGAEWTPLGAESPCGGGNDDSCFQGKLDGNGKMISGLTVNITKDYGGLFGYTGEHAEIRSVGLSSVNITAMKNSGGLVGYNNGDISNSYVSGTVSSSSGNTTGGLVGRNAGNISNSYATGTVSGFTGSGGLVGQNFGGSISNSYAASTVSGGNNFVGGLVGVNDGNISNSYATGTVSGTSGSSVFIGGLAGDNDGNISNSYATGTVSGISALGGLVGRNNGSISGINYFADNEDSNGGSDGIGHDSSCDSMVCVQAPAMTDTNAARAEWLRDHDDFDESDLGWESTVWANLDAAGFPCLKDMPAGAPSC